MLAKKHLLIGQFPNPRRFAIDWQMYQNYVTRASRLLIRANCFQW